MKTAIRVMYDALREAFAEAVLELTEDQTAFLYEKVYPQGVPDHKLPEAYELVRRTLSYMDNPA